MISGGQMSAFDYGFLLARKSSSLDLSKLSLEGFCFHWFSDSDFVYYKYNARFSRYDFEQYEVIVLGDIFVAHGNLDVKESLQKFVEKSDWESIDNLSGRFAVVVFNKLFGRLEKVIHDPIGSRALFYSTDHPGIITSHSALFSRLLGVQKCEEAVRFRKNQSFKSIKTKLLPADVTMYESVYGVPANHYYCFQGFHVVRYWPRQSIAESNLGKLGKITAEYFEKFIKNLQADGVKPVIGCTSGVDCRLVIAAFHNAACFFELITWDRNISSSARKIIDDVRSKVLMPHVLIAPGDLSDKVNVRDIKENAFVNRGEFVYSDLPVITAASVKGNSVFLRGLGGEIIRGDGYSKKATSLTNQAEFVEFAYNSYKTRRVLEPDNEFVAFVKNAYLGFHNRIGLSAASVYNFNTGDMVYWEHRMSMWGASLCNEGDAALKNLVAINSRKIFEAGMGLPDELRLRRPLLIDLAALFNEDLSNISFE